MGEKPNHKKAQVTETKLNSTNMVIHERKQLAVVDRCNHHAFSSVLQKLLWQLWIFFFQIT